MTDPFEHPDVRRFLKRAERDMLPKLRDSALSMILFSEKPDMKLAVEFGTSRQWTWVKICVFRQMGPPSECSR